MSTGLAKVSWTYLTPFAFIAVLGTAAWMVFLPRGILFVKYLLYSARSLSAILCGEPSKHLRFTKNKVDVKWII